ncbi:hypothetical protein QZH41_013035 [Actinostola sp. cb2023]|nr:hypothetical protein QZH41_013035 [Actinostola sp. cb2023]
MPITIEPTKPRMCHDERFLNCWIRDCPFSLDYITDLPRYMELNHFQTTFDDKSGYDHVRLYPASATFFGLEWKGWYFAYATLPFGWKASAYLYHSIGLAATHLIRSSGVPCSQYIDDRHVGQLRMPPDVKHAIPNFQLAEMAAFIACSTLISLGYFIGLHKSTLSRRWLFKAAATGTKKRVRNPIAVKEALALLRTLESLSGDTSNARIDAFVDNKVLLDSWIKQTSRSPAITTVMKQLFSFTMSRNLALVMHLVPSRANLADDLSRVVSDLDCTLSLTTWRQIDVTFGPHSIDMMALPSNVRTDRAGRPLRFFSQLPCPESEGTNVFAQNIAEHENCYVFPPFSLIGPLLKHLQSQGCPVSIVVPDLTPRKYWWPLICRRASSSFMLGSKGTSNVLLFPAKNQGQSVDPSSALQWDLWVFRLPPSQY